VYRPGSTSVTAAFFAELGDVLDSLATSTDPTVLVGDVNIRLERTADPNAVEFSELLCGYGLVQHVSGATHDAGGTLDVVCTRDDLPPPIVDVIDVVSATPSNNLRHVIPADHGSVSTPISSRPICLRLPSVTNNSGQRSTVTIS